MSEPSGQGGSRFRVGLLVAASAVALVSCSGSGAGTPSPSSGGAGGSGAATRIAATEAEFTLGLAPATAPAGSVTFAVTNGGTVVHEFVVLRTDTKADQLPVASDEPEIDEEAEGIEVVDEIEDIAAGGTGELTVDLAAGHYVVICNLPGHYQAGMHADLSVTE